MSFTQVRASTPIQLSEITSSIELTEGVIFEPNRGLLVGVYGDQLSAYRARKEWLATLHESFLLDEEEDLATNIQPTPDGAWYVLSCEFLSATARYAFWRIIRGQSPEEQYRIESAHVASEWARAHFAPDMRNSTAPESKESKHDPLAALDVDGVTSTKHTLEAIIERVISGTKVLFRPPEPK